MKKIVLIITAVIAVLLLGNFLLSDNTPESTENKSEKAVVLSTFTIIEDMVGEVGGDRIESISLTKPGAEIHGYQVTPGDLVRAAEATIIFENGMGLELWTEKLRASIPDVPIIQVSENVQVIDITEDAYAGKPNPHAWMSPQQGLVYVENIRKALTEIQPEDADYFAERAKAYSNQILVVDEKMSVAMSALPENNRVLVTCEGAFSYLTTDYGLEEVFLWAINSESQGSPKQVARVIETVKERKIPTVFCESTVEPKLQNEVANASDASLGGILFVDSLSTANGPAATYLDLLEHTAETIITGLTATNN
ncbi:MAG: manganese transport system substrate-binding protein [Candidatus Paceibacteria bacterium]|jgi:manganese transport system substrate-binding protein